MAIKFPDNPINNQVFQAGNTKYVYNATRGTWDVAQVLGATNIGDLADINLTVQPEQISLNVDADGPGHAPTWTWTWNQSTLPFSRLAITNSPQLSVPVYQQGTYQINNFANTVHGDMTQAHSFKLKWIEGAGDANLIDWVTTTTVTMSHPDINDGADTLVQRLSFTVPSTITLPTLTAPSVTYTITNNGAGSYDFTGTQVGANPKLGPFYRGGTYTFNIDAAGHPLYLTTDNGTGFVSGSYVGEWTDGVTGSRTDSGTLTFVVPQTAPDVLYYQCGNHSSMRGTIEVKDLAVETNENGNYIIYGQHSQEGHTQPMEIRPLPELASQMCIVYDKTLNQWMPQDLATYVENTPSFENKIKEVAGTATLVAPDGTSLVAGVEIYNDASYLPQIDNTRGDIAFATNTSALYIWDGTTWVTAVADGTATGGGGGGGGGGTGSPTVTGVTPANYDGTDQTTFTITGTNFDVGTYVDFITAGGTAYRASQTQIVTQGEITAITPQAFLESDGPLDIKVTTNAGGTVTAPDMIQTGGSPVWTTAAGTLYENAFADDVAAGDNSYRLEMNLNETLVATDPDGQPVTYSVESGSLPPNGVLNPNTGAITGTLPTTGVLTADTTYSFVGGSTDSSGNLTTRNFNIIVKNSLGGLYTFSTQTFTAGGTNISGRSAQTGTAIRSSYGSVSWMDATYDGYQGLTIGTSNGHQTWLVPIDGTYTITAYGAAGGHGPTANGGYGSWAQGSFTLQKGSFLHIYCGQRGVTNSASNGSAGGGGGTFVFATGVGSNTISIPANELLIAGGGGGGGTAATIAQNGHGVDGSTTSSGTANRTGSRAGGTNGSGGGSGIVGDWGGADGGGLLSNGVSGSYSSGNVVSNSNGKSYANGFAGGQGGGSYGTEGGFGGGGAASWAAGGGGGYSGGAGDFSSGSGPGETDTSPNGGGGGGIYLASSGTSTSTGVSTSYGSGYVVITYD